MKIFFADLVHTWNKKAIWTVPFNVGLVASYAQKTLGNAGVDCSVTIFKDPVKIISAIRKEKPDVVALAYYLWNEELNRKVFEIVKQDVPNALTVGGGPNITSINATEEGAIKFFSKQKNCDAYIVNQGEKGFSELMSKYIEVDKDINKLRSITVPGSLTNDLKKNNVVHVGEDIGTLDDLNDIPSPYLNGLLDKFLDEGYQPMLETNRSCPYRCTFCAWGIGTVKLARFDENRILKEIEYISEKSKNTTTLFIVDANFGILERDKKFAAKLYECHKKKGFPHWVTVQWNKTRSDRIINTAKELKEISQVGASMQSLNEDTLRAVKRKNFTLTEVAKMKNELSKYSPKKWYSELIFGMPHETKESHTESVRKLIDLDLEVWVYNLHLIPGTEMTTKDYRKKYFKKTGWRLHTNCYGEYDGEKIYELQEVVLETPTLTVEDFRYFRFFHFLQQMMWSKKWYYDYLQFMKLHNLHPVDVFDKVIKKCKKDNGKMGILYSAFMKDYDTAESFKTAEELKEYWEKDSNFNRLKDANYGKLNMLYTYKTVIDNRDAFIELLLGIAKEYFASLNLDSNNFVEACEEILKFQNAKFIQINNKYEIKEQIVETFKYDVLAWTLSGYGQLNKLKNQQKYKFHLPEKQRKTLNMQLALYKSQSVSAALQNMTPYTDPQQFFYKV